AAAPTATSPTCLACESSICRSSEISRSLSATTSSVILIAFSTVSLSAFCPSFDSSKSESISASSRFFIDSQSFPPPAAAAAFFGPLLGFDEPRIELLGLVAEFRQLDNCALDRAVRIAGSGPLQVAFLFGSLGGCFGVGDFLLQVVELLVQRLKLVGSRGSK